MVLSFHTATAKLMGAKRGLYSRESAYIFEYKPPPQYRSCLLLKKEGDLLSGGYGIYVYLYVCMYVCMFVG